MRLCLPARMGGGGKAESLPWSGPAGEARHTGVTILLWETRGQSLWRSRLSGNGGDQPPLGRNAAYKRHPCTARRSRIPCWRTPSGHRCCATSAAPPCPRQRETGGRSARREARVLAGQFKNAAPSGARSAGQSATSENPTHFRNAPDRHPKGQDYRLGPR
jgi:hypothetical protein